MTDGVIIESAETFRRDGFVVVRNVLDQSTLERLAGAVARVTTGGATTDMSAMAVDLDAAPDGDGTQRGAFLAGVDHWRNDPDLAWFAQESALPRLVAELLGSDALWLYEDSVLVKEPRAAERTHWHQDAAYFQVEGEQICTTWCPLDPVDARSGSLSYAVGSHASGEVYRPNLFVSDEPLPGTEGSTVPDTPTEPVVTVELAPGDIVVHHARTLHAAGGNDTDRARRAISVRYCGDDARYRIRPGTPLKPHHHAVAEGSALGGPDCPQVWP